MPFTRRAFAQAVGASLAVLAGNASADPAAVLESTWSATDPPISVDPNSEFWFKAPHVAIDHSSLGQSISGAPTEIRSRWSTEYLYLLFICPYDELNLRPDPHPATETPSLWNWDVAEAFIGSDFEHIGRYKEFEVSPQGEWVDLDIDRDSPKTQQGMAWNSGYAVKARIDAQKKVWYGEMRIPFRAIIGSGTRSPSNGLELRIGLFRCAGAGEKRIYYAWRPPGGRSFHVPQAFGTLRLTNR